MTLTLSDGPLSGSPPETNYSVEGPQHKLRTLNVNGEHIEDAAWSCPEPLDESLEARDHITISAEVIAVEVDGEQVE